VLRHGQLDWDRLQRRLGSRALVADEAGTAPASYAAFDVLADAGDDWRSMPWSSRRGRLEEFAAANWRLPLQLVPGTLDENEARAWFNDYRQAGIEGLVVKARHEPCLPAKAMAEGKVPRVRGGSSAWTGMPCPSPGPIGTMSPAARCCSSGIIRRELRRPRLSSRS
jgi:ATP dependent DNA ligase domain